MAHPTPWLSELLSPALTLSLTSAEHLPRLGCHAITHVKAGPELVQRVADNKRCAVRCAEGHMIETLFRREDGSASAASGEDDECHGENGR